MDKHTIFDVLAGATALGVLGVGVWAGEIENELSHKADTADIARIEQQVKNNSQDINEVKGDVKEILREIRSQRSGD